MITVTRQQILDKTINQAIRDLMSLKMDLEEIRVLQKLMKEMEALRIDGKQCFYIQIPLWGGEVLFEPPYYSFGDSVKQAAWEAQLGPFLSTTEDIEMAPISVSVSGVSSEISTTLSGIVTIVEPS